MELQRFSDWQRMRNRDSFDVEPTFMKFSLSLALLTALFITSCEEVDQPPSRVRHQSCQISCRRHSSNSIRLSSSHSTRTPAADAFANDSGDGACSCPDGCAYQSRQGRSSLRNSCSRKTARGGESLFAGQICGRGRIPARYGSKRSCTRVRFFWFRSLRAAESKVAADSGC